MIFFSNPHFLNNGKNVAGYPVKCQRARDTVGNKNNQDWKNIFHLCGHRSGNIVLCALTGIRLRAGRQTDLIVSCDTGNNG